MFHHRTEVDVVLLFLRLAVTTILSNRAIIAIIVVQNDNTFLLRFGIDILVQLLN